MLIRWVLSFFVSISAERSRRLEEEGGLDDAFGTGKRTISCVWVIFIAREQLSKSRIINNSPSFQQGMNVIGVDLKRSRDPLFWGLIYLAEGG